MAGSTLKKPIRGRKMGVGAQNDLAAERPAELKTILAWLAKTKPNARRVTVPKEKQRETFT